MAVKWTVNDASMASSVVPVGTVVEGTTAKIWLNPKKARQGRFSVFWDVTPRSVSGMLYPSSRPKIDDRVPLMVCTFSMSA